MPRNIEIKAHVPALSAIHHLAKKLSNSEGTILYQEDTFFKVPKGRLKLRKISGQHEELIYYNRPDGTGPKISNYKKVERPLGGISDDLKELLSEALGTRGEVIKKRTLYIVDQTRIHIDEVKDLGSFVELEVMLRDDQSSVEGEHIAKDLMKKLDIKEENLIEKAYMDLLLES